MSGGAERAGSLKMGADAEDTKAARRAARKERKARKAAKRARREQERAATGQSAVKKRKMLENERGEEVTAAGPPAERFDRFQDTPFTAGLVELLSKSFESPSPIQAAAWPAACAEKDIVAVAKTGSGKTLAFLLPVFHLIGREQGDAVRQPPGGLVIAPTRELAGQIKVECDKFSLAGGAFTSLCCYGGTPVGPQVAALTKSHPHIVIGTPGRLSDLLRQQALRLAKCKAVVLDEADRMLDMGFEAQIKQIFTALPGVDERQTMLFSATWPKAVRKLASGYLKQDEARIAQIFIGENIKDGELEANKSISQRFIQATDDEKDAKLYKFLCELKEGNRAVVFANTKRRVESLCKRFAEFGTCAVHGDKPQHQREKALQSFCKDECPLMFATDVAARGLDIQGVTHVINYDMARDVESYVHRIGRTGRAGALGESVTFWNPDYDKPCTPALCKIARDAGAEVPTWLSKFEAFKQNKQWKLEKAHL